MPAGTRLIAITARAARRCQLAILPGRLGPRSSPRRWRPAGAALRFTHGMNTGPAKPSYRDRNRRTSKMNDTLSPIDTGVLGQLSNELAGAVERAGAGTVTVYGRQRMPATGIIWSED